MNISKIWAIILPFIRQTKNYALITGAILFLIGILGFAFRSDNSLPDVYLAGALVLGFWGILVGIWNSGKVASAVKEQSSEDSQYSSKS